MAIAYIGDRRAHVRFQVVGTMPVSVHANEKLEMINAGTSGALVEGALPLPVNAEYTMQLVLEGHISEATIKVRRVARVSGGATDRYRMGIEFLSLSPEAEELFHRMASAEEADL